MSDVAVSSREILGVVYCPTCKVDTIPEARTGRCFFCDAVIAEPTPRAKIVRFPLVKVRCCCGHHVDTHDHQGRCFECPCGLFTPAEVEK